MILSKVILRRGSPSLIDIKGQNTNLVENLAFTKPFRECLSCTYAGYEGFIPSYLLKEYGKDNKLRLILLRHLLRE